MYRSIFILLWVLSAAVASEAQMRRVVADSATRVPLPNASVYDRNGRSVGLSDNRGVLPTLTPDCYPITVRYIGFDEKTVGSLSNDTIFLSENVSQLPEMVVESRRQRVLHILAYVREYSSLSTYTDTVFLFREKMVDYMLPSDPKSRFRGWTTPRILTSRSYYRFTDCYGLDSVSDVSRHHFSWSDWMGIAPPATLPRALRTAGADTVRGRYSDTEIWRMDDDSITVDIDVLADTSSRKWVPNLAAFFHKNLDFERFRVSYRYGGAGADTTLSPLDLAGYSFDIESNGRGHSMFRFNRINEPYFVSTRADVYILDREYITVKEARKWSDRKFDTDETGIYEPAEAPELSAPTLALIDRVSRIDKDGIRLNVTPDHNLVNKNYGRSNFKIFHRALTLLKDLTGITRYKFYKKSNTNWRQFRNEQKRKNKRSADGRTFTGNADSNKPTED